MARFLNRYMDFDYEMKKLQIIKNKIQKIIECEKETYIIPNLSPLQDFLCSRNISLNTSTYEEIKAVILEYNDGRWDGTYKIPNENITLNYKDGFKHGKQIYDEDIYNYEDGLKEGVQIQPPRKHKCKNGRWV